MGRRHGWGRPLRSKIISRRSGSRCRASKNCPIRSGPAAISSRNSPRIAKAMTKVLLFTSQDIGNDVFAYLHSRDDIDLVVVTQRTRRDEVYGYRATLDLCVEKAVAVHTPKALDEAFLCKVEQLAPDLVICAYYPRIFPRRLIDIPPLGCVNVHPGLLPHYRGTFPTPWCILNNETEIGVTLHVMDEGIDTGDILVQRSYPIGPDETGHELYRRSMKLCADLLIENFDA